MLIPVILPVAGNTFIEWMEIDSGPTATGSSDVEVDCEVNSKRIQGGSFEFKGKKESRVQVSDTHKKVEREYSYGRKA